MTRIFKEHETMDPITNVSEREAVEKTNRLRSTLASPRLAHGSCPPLDPPIKTTGRAGSRGVGRT